MSDDILAIVLFYKLEIEVSPCSHVYNVSPTPWLLACDLFEVGLEVAVDQVAGKRMGRMRTALEVDG